MKAIPLCLLILISFPSFSSSSQRIIHGENAQKADFVVKLDIIIDNKRTKHCGGYIVSETQFITAAHCVTIQEKTNSFEAREINAIQVFHGDNSRSVMASNEKYKYKVTKLEVHSRFNALNELEYDIAMLTVDRAFAHATQAPVNTRNNEISFMTKQLNAPKTLTAIDAYINPDIVGLGWGLTESMYDIPDLLKSNYMSILNDEDCKSDALNKRSYFCSQGIGSEGSLKTDTCAGDSGSPILYRDENGKIEIVGIVSYGAEKCDTSSSFYTSVHEQYNDFILPRLVGNALPEAQLKDFFERMPKFYDENKEVTTVHRQVVAYNGAWNIIRGLLQYTDLQNVVHTIKMPLWGFGYTDFNVPKGSRNVMFQLDGSRKAFYKKQYSPVRLDRSNIGVSAYGIVTNNWWKEDF